MLFWPIMGQRKSNLVVFLWKRRMSSVISNALILAKNTTELVLLFHKKTTKLVFFWPNIGQKSIKVLIKIKYIKTYKIFVKLKEFLYISGQNNIINSSSSSSSMSTEDRSLLQKVWDKSEKFDPTESRTL